MLKNINLAIFDLDGTLVDSMGIWEKIDNDYLKIFGYKKPINLKEDITHLNFYETALYFKKRFSISDSPDEILETWLNMAFNEYKNNIKLKPGAKKFLYKLKDLGIKIALATSNYQSLLEICLKSNNVFELFDSITTTEEVSRGKDFPDIYLLSCEKHKIHPKNCIVFEDILCAVKSAKNAGMRVVAVKDSITTFKEELLLIDESDYYLKSFNELI
ncbi:HAD family hydrolase [Clostridium tarantellae]|uniref:HAD-IA family hydrolase n=1 Tax=Clostridium tarantellae TaxID=39493 RepID=A0A6I1MQU3_9CLOT|nr:HAD family phosphatase [Clostridium tarantellae]MPQ43251.1 HAD-IA family hydrolase [Clostridium tarantellae]